MPRNAPMFCTMRFAAVHHWVAATIFSGGRFCASSALRIAGPTSEPLKKPTPQRPTTPATQSNMPKIAGPRHCASPKRLP